MFPGLPHLQFLIAYSMQKLDRGVEGLGTRLGVDMPNFVNSEVQKTTTNAETDAT